MNRASYGDVTSEYRALRSAAAVVEATHDLVRVDGPDASSFLQGILSQDLEAMTPGEIRRSFLLNPSGKLTALLWILKGAEQVLIFCDAGLGESVAETLGYYRIRVKADVSTDDRPVWSLVGPDALELLGRPEPAGCRQRVQ